MAREHLRAGTERNNSRERNHYVLIDNTGRVISDLFPDTNEGRIRFRNLAAARFAGKEDFLGFGDLYLDKDGGDKKHGFEAAVQHITTNRTVVTAKNAAQFLPQKK